MDFSITVPLDPSAEHRDTILAGLADFNAEEAGPSGGTPLAIMLSDGRGADQGGLWGTAIYDWLHIELLFVPRRLRGRSIGTEL
ncbi:MAG: GCN5-like N-acetyltransferase, partial [Alphaproteobacteria bacterium]|nr:GCN5-like N-acetyltransferase [Alphaproteobacteria bacterium]